jgi:hypothetical protein
MNEREVFMTALQKGSAAKRRAYLDAACQRAVSPGVKLNWGTTVHDDGMANVLSGSAPGFDWSFAGNQDRLVNFQTGDHRNKT